MRFREDMQQRGFVLVNALVIVAALAAAAVFLLDRAESGRIRLNLDQKATQTRLYLDSFEALALTLLDRDLRGGNSDHLDEGWAKARHNVTLDRGRVAGSVADLQGRFNINWLLSDEIPAARAGIDRLAESIGLPLARVAAIEIYLRGKDRSALASYARQPVPLAPRGGPLGVIEELRQIEGLSETEFERLAPLMTALPVATPANVNTASFEVLSSLFPEGTENAARAVISARRQTPFASLEEFLEFLKLETDLDTDRLDDRLFGVESDWFLVESTARSESQEMHRRSVIQRDGPLRRARVVYRLRTRE